ncbi:hypothetical protein EVAR_12096_1 [Eumeta japonica]|uniref:Uncharacterized protein n=1 Tax=Eumeta variegata TaxID=151549 RepID=A0A4C1U555_EUMVA|nr:hypothetical protein EVAR_12096_1 [Eumeta japonica]
MRRMGKKPKGQCAENNCTETSPTAAPPPLGAAVTSRNCRNSKKKAETIIEFHIEPVESIGELSICAVVGDDAAAGGGARPARRLGERLTK